MATDPVCGCEVVEVRPGNSAGYRGEMYVFCSRGCLDEFKKDPEYYYEGAAGERMAGARRTADESARPAGGREIPVRSGRKQASEVGGPGESEGIRKRVEEKAGRVGHKSEKWWDKVADWFKERV